MDHSIAAPEVNIADAFMPNLSQIARGKIRPLPKTELATHTTRQMLWHRAADHNDRLMLLDQRVEDVARQTGAAHDDAIHCGAVKLVEHSFFARGIFVRVSQQNAIPFLPPDIFDSLDDL